MLRPASNGEGMIIRFYKDKSNGWRSRLLRHVLGTDVTHVTAQVGFKIWHMDHQKHGWYDSTVITRAYKGVYELHQAFILDGDVMPDLKYSRANTWYGINFRYGLRWPRPHNCSDSVRDIALANGHNIMREYNPFKFMDVIDDYCRTQRESSDWEV